MKKAQTGFSAVEVLMVIIVIGLVIGAGWYVWQARSGANDTKETIQATTNSNSETIEYIPPQIIVAEGGTDEQRKIKDGLKEFYEKWVTETPANSSPTTRGQIYTSIQNHLTGSAASAITLKYYVVPLCTQVVLKTVKINNPAVSGDSATVNVDVEQPKPLELTMVNTKYESALGEPLSLWQIDGFNCPVDNHQ